MMKTLFRIMALWVLLLGLVACSDDDKEEIKPLIDVNYANIAGTWQLSEWNGEEMNDVRYYYITFDRKEKDGKRVYKIYTNLNSATSQRVSGSFVLSKDEGLRDMITGTYDYQLSTDDAWSHKYVIRELHEEDMVWVAEDDTEEIRIYSRCEKVPEDIVAGTRAVR